MKLANHLDQIGREKEADYVDALIKMARPIGGPPENMPKAIKTLTSEVRKGFLLQMGGFPAWFGAIIDACLDAGLINAGQKKKIEASYWTK